MRIFRIRLGLLAAVMTIGALAGAEVVKLQIVQGRPLVDGVYVNGEGPFQFLVDTGTTLNHLEPGLAESIGMKPTFRTELVSSTGLRFVTGTSGATVAVGGVKADGQTFLFAGFEALRKHYPGVKGVLGQEFLSQFDYLLDLKGKRIEFGKREPEASKVRVPFRTVTGRPVVTTSLGSLVLDSGANAVTVFHVESPAMTHEMITMTGSLRVGTVPSELIIDGRRVWRGEAVAIPRPAETGATGLLPVRLFKTVYICNSERYVIFD